MSRLSATTNDLVLVSLLAYSSHILNSFTVTRRRCFCWFLVSFSSSTTSAYYRFLSCRNTYCPSYMPFLVNTHLPCCDVMMEPTNERMTHDHEITIYMIWGGVVSVLSLPVQSRGPRQVCRCLGGSSRWHC